MPVPKRIISAARQHLRKFPTEKWAMVVLDECKKQNEKMVLFHLENRKFYTPAELKFSEILKKCGIDFIREKEIRIKETGKVYFLDFFLPKLKFVFEIDGGVHENSVVYDTDRDYVLYKERRYNTIRIKNDVVLNDEEQVIKLLIKAFQVRKIDIENQINVKSNPHMVGKLKDILFVTDKAYKEFLSRII